MILTFIGSSCMPLSKVGNKGVEVVTLSKDDYKKLDGIYSNELETMVGEIIHLPYYSFQANQGLPILNQLFNNYPQSAWRDKNGEIINPKEKWIKIEFQSNKSATVSMYHNEDYVFSKKIHGKFKNGYFYLRPKIYILPFLPLVFGYNFERARIGQTTDKDLIIDYTVKRWGFAIAAGSADKGATSTIYKRKID